MIATRASILSVVLAWQALSAPVARAGDVCMMDPPSDVSSAGLACLSAQEEHAVMMATSASRQDDSRGVMLAAATESESGQAGLGADPGAEPSVLQHQDVAVPTYRVGQTFVVQVRLNGSRDAKLILDTGAEISLLSHDVVLDLGLFPTSSTPTVTLNTVSGTVRADVIIIERMAVGGAEAHGVAVAVHDLPEAPPGVDGLLGLTFLNKFVVTLDPQQGTLHLRQRH
jgi:clan AA aspartic protease (TIGR02281 family)